MIKDYMTGDRLW